MPKRTLAVLTAFLWDLRAQCEAQIRTLTNAQRQVDTLRDSTGVAARTKALAAFHRDLERVLKVNGEIRAALKSAIGQAEKLAPLMLLSVQ
jgi:ABC-type transporter Mla subunit MlaD